MRRALLGGLFCSFVSSILPGAGRADDIAKDVHSADNGPRVVSPPVNLPPFYPIKIALVENPSITIDPDLLRFLQERAVRETKARLERGGEIGLELEKFDGERAYFRGFSMFLKDKNPVEIAKFRGAPPGAVLFEIIFERVSKEVEPDWVLKSFYFDR
jgi:hypothetical protein